MAPWLPRFSAFLILASTPRSIRDRLREASRRVIVEPTKGGFIGELHFNSETKQY